MIQLILYLWQLPQNIIGAFLRDLLSYCDKCFLLNKYEDCYIYGIEAPINITLGEHIFVGPNAYKEDIEYQIELSYLSKVMGPFYLIYVILYIITAIVAFTANKC